MQNTDHQGVVVFGEVLMRLATKCNQRLLQARELEIGFTGAEGNAAVSLQNFGVPSYLVSCVPDNDVGQACMNFFRQYGVDTSEVRKKGSRLGTFYLETGANQRPSKVIYDRSGSSITDLAPGDIPWRDIFTGKQWLHLSGSAPALSRSMADVTLEACKIARECGVTVSIDLNFRKKLWGWDSSCAPQELARKTMKQILPHVDVIIGNEEDAADVLDIHAGNTDVTSGHLEISKYPQVAAEIKSQFPQIRYVAITLRESISASHNNWGGMLYHAGSGQSFFAPLKEGVYQPYMITHIVDRVGGGDSFSAGLIYGLITGMSDQEAVSFAAAASCLKHSIPGDFNLVSVEDVAALAGGNASGRVQR